MDQLQIYNKNMAMEKGSKSLENNEFFQDLTTLMENETFTRFFNKHMNDWIDVKSSVTYMKLYQELREKYKEINGEELDKRLVVYMLCQIMRDKQLRPLSIRTVDEIYKNKKKDFFVEFHKYMTNENNKLLLKNSS